MTTKTKIVLTVSLTAYLLSLTGALWGIFLPVGAIFFGLFMIFNALGKEAALFDEEQSLRASLAENNASTVQPSRPVQGHVSLPRLAAH